MATTAFVLRPVPPFRLDLTVWLLRRRPHNLVDRWENSTYRRVLVAEGRPVEVGVTQTGPAEAPELRVEFTGQAAMGGKLAQALTRMLGIGLDLGDFYRAAAADERLHTLAARFTGFKPPRFPTLFEALINAVACQQLSLTLGIHLLNRLATAYGPSLTGEGASRVGFPRPADLAALTPEALRALGFSRSKAETIINAAAGAQNGSLPLEDLAAQDDAAALQVLTGLRGVGRWSAEYVLLRGLGRWHIFPGKDSGVRRRLQDWLKLSEPLDDAGVSRLMLGWQPFAGLIYLHFLLLHLAAEGHISA